MNGYATCNDTPMQSLPLRSGYTCGLVPSWEDKLQPLHRRQVTMHIKQLHYASIVSARSTPYEAPIRLNEFDMKQAVDICEELCDYTGAMRGFKDPITKLYKNTNINNDNDNNNDNDKMPAYGVTNMIKDILLEEQRVAKQVQHIIDKEDSFMIVVFPKQDIWISLEGTSECSVRLRQFRRNKKGQITSSKDAGIVFLPSVLHKIEQMNIHDNLILVFLHTLKSVTVVSLTISPEENEDDDNHNNQKQNNNNRKKVYNLDVKQLYFLLLPELIISSCINIKFQELCFLIKGCFLHLLKILVNDNCMLSFDVKCIDVNAYIDDIACHLAICCYGFHPRSIYISIDNKIYCIRLDYALLAIDNDNTIWKHVHTANEVILNMNNIIFFPYLLTYITNTTLNIIDERVCNDVLLSWNCSNDSKKNIYMKTKLDCVILNKNPCIIVSDINTINIGNARIHPFIIDVNQQEYRIYCPQTTVRLLSDDVSIRNIYIYNELNNDNLCVFTRSLVDEIQLTTYRYDMNCHPISLIKQTKQETKQEQKNINMISTSLYASSSSSGVVEPERISGIQKVVHERIYSNINSLKEYLMLPRTLKEVSWFVSGFKGGIKYNINEEMIIIEYIYILFNSFVEKSTQEQPIRLIMHRIPILNNFKYLNNNDNNHRKQQSNQCMCEWNTSSPCYKPYCIISDIIVYRINNDNIGSNILQKTETTADKKLDLSQDVGFLLSMLSDTTTNLDNQNNMNDNDGIAHDIVKGEINAGNLMNSLLDTWD